MCADCPDPCCGDQDQETHVCQVLNPAEEMDNKRSSAGTGTEKMPTTVGTVCQKGCGLLLPRDDTDHQDGKQQQQQHSCVDALRLLTDALEERSLAVEHDARMARLRWGRREQALLAQVSALQSEGQLSALRYQQKLHRYMLNISSIAEQVTGYYKGDLRKTEEGKSNASKTSTCAEQEPKQPNKTPEVNGKELSKSSHEDTAEGFRCSSAKDPIMVQVIRRTPGGRPHGSPQEIHVVDVCTQTDITFEHIMALAKLRPTTPPVPDVCPFLLSDSCHSLQEQEFYEGTDYLSPLPVDGDRTEEFEYEEVELCRLNAQEKLGLTLCYRTDEEDDVAIYVSEIGPNSIAARDGRIREGDRILQINGQDVQDRQEAVAALSNEDCRNIILLVARPELQLEEAWLDDEHSEFLEQLKMEMLEEQQREEMELAALQEEQENQQGAEDDGPTCSTLAHGNDRAAKSRGESSSERDMLAHIQRRLSQCLRDRPAPGSTRLQEEEDDDDDEEQLEEEGEREGDRFQQLLELKCQIRNSGEYDLFYSRRSTIECSVAGEQGHGVQRELRMLNEELRSIELECQNIMQAHNLRKGQQSPSSANKDQSLRRGGQGGDPARGKLADINERLEKSDKDSSSAYNTAESSRSTPLAMDRSPEHSLQRMVSLTNQKNLMATGYCLSPSPSPTHHHRTVTLTGKGGNNGNNRSESEQQTTPPRAEEERKGKVKPPLGSSQIPYLSPSHSSQQRQQANNIPAHARHYQSYMQLIQQRSAVEYAQSQLSLLSVCKEPSQRPAGTGTGDDEPKMEWKVKIRSDGTRYITKRPARDRILRERALKIKEERSGGMTTDDDAMSEMKLGRYWSKEERKQQMVRAKEQRRRREFMQRSRLESLRETEQSSSEGRSKEVSIIELSHKKMLKKRNKKILDNWMTIQELMTHGTKAPEGAKVHNAFLSVTTV